jgi:hypothetical protein
MVNGMVNGLTKFQAGGGQWVPFKGTPLTPRHRATAVQMPAEDCR